MVTYQLQVFWLGAEPEELALMLNGPAHSLSAEEMARLLYQFGTQGDLYFYTWDRVDGDEVERPVPTPTLDELHTALAKNMRLCYALTAQGGQRWEAVARPRWERYSETIGLERVTIRAMNPNLVRELLALYPQTHSDEEILPESIRWDEARPWQATYWKPLPVGYRVTFQTIAKDHELRPDWMTIETKWQELLTWYTHPFADDGT